MPCNMVLLDVFRARRNVRERAVQGTRTSNRRARARARSPALPRTRSSASLTRRCEPGVLPQINLRSRRKRLHAMVNAMRATQPHRSADAPRSVINFSKLEPLDRGKPRTSAHRATRRAPKRLATQAVLCIVCFRGAAPIDAPKGARERARIIHDVRVSG